MLISVVVCTYGRAAALANLLTSLDAQSYRSFEALIVDGNGDPSPARETVQLFRQRADTRMHINVIPSEKGLTRQRNVGLQRASGDIICFLDDDVMLEPDFLARLVDVFQGPEVQDVGGITGYDVLNYPTPVTWRWQLRRAFGVIPKVDPGGVDHLGRAVPLSFISPFSGYKEIGWLSGFCMAYRRIALGSLRFDESLPTYGGEDRDFSIRIGRRWRLLICGDLRLQHRSAMQGRDSDLQRNFQSSFGAGRRFAKYAHRKRDHLTLIRTLVGDCLIDVLFFVSRPSRHNLSLAAVRIRGFFSGLFHAEAACTTVPLPSIDSVRRPQDRA